MKIIATAMLMASFVLGSIALTATDAQARVHNRHVVAHRTVVVRGRHGVTRRHVVVRRDVRGRRHRAHRRVVVRRDVVGPRGRHHGVRRVCRTVLVRHHWVKRCDARRY